MTDENFLSRWSRRKAASKAASEAGTVGPTADTAPAPAGAQSRVPVASGAPSTEPEPQSLPPVESLTPESDFTPFMVRGVDEGVKREALKTLFRDPRFNVMDGLDVYIDDYSKPDPLPEGWLAKLNQVARLGDWQPPPPGEPAAAEKLAQEQPPGGSSPPAPVDTPTDGKPPSQVG